MRRIPNPDGLSWGQLLGQRPDVATGIRGISRHHTESSTVGLWNRGIRDLYTVVWEGRGREAPSYLD